MRKEEKLFNNASGSETGNIGQVLLRIWFPVNSFPICILEIKFERKPEKVELGGKSHLFNLTPKPSNRFENFSGHLFSGELCGT
ncbi:MAG: hypothetical protein AAGA96_08365 [Verrucomicrobiota bacterium]